MGRTNQNPLTTSPTYLHLHLHLHLPTPHHIKEGSSTKKVIHTVLSNTVHQPSCIFLSLLLPSFLPFFPGLRPDSRLSPTQHRIRTFQPSTHPPSYFYHSRTHLDSLGRTYIHLLIS